MKNKFYLFFLFILSFNINIFSADIEVSGNNNQTKIEKTANGIDSVNIANPDSQGVSYNDFDKFNVNEKGVIINNSMDVGRSQLGGVVEKNPNLNNNAKTVITEVTGKNLSQINGYIEMFGGKADFILANPNGIIVNGGGFINIPNATLTTGIYNSVDNNFIVENGEIVINAPGIDAKDTDYFAIISRVAKIYGDIFAGDEVKVAVGQNEYNPNTKEVKALQNTKSAEVAIDSTELGGIYAGRIAIVSTEKGVGVNSNSEMVASAGDFTIDANGNVVLKIVQAAGEIKTKSDNLKIENVEAYGNVSLNSNGLAVVNNLASNKDISIKAGDVINNDSINGSTVNIDSTSLSNGKIYASKDVNISSSNVTQNKDGYIASGNDINITSTTLTNNGIVLASNNLQVNNTNSLTNSGTIEAKNQSINSANIVSNGDINSYDSINIKSDNTQNNGAIYGEQVSLESSLTQTSTGNIQGSNVNVKGTSISNDGNIKATNTIDITSDEVVNNNLISSKGINIKSKKTKNSKDIKASNTVVLTTDTMENSGTISASSVSIQTGTLTNSGLIASNTTEINGNDISNEATGKIKSNASINMNGTYLKNNGELFSTEIVLTTPNDFINNELITGLNGVDITANNVGNNEGKTISGKNVKITSKGTVNNSGEINGNITVNSIGSFTNTAKGSITGENLIFITPQMVNDGSILSYTLSYKDGTIKNSGTITTNDFVEKLNSIINTGIVVSYGKLEADRVDNSKKITGRDVVINKEYKHNTSSELLSLNEIKITSENGTFVITGNIKANGVVTIDAKDSILNTNGLRGFSGVTVNTENFTNNAIVESAIDVIINANNVTNAKGAIIYAGENLNILGSGTLENRGSLESAGNINVGGTGKRFTNVRNISGNIQGNGTVNIYTNNLENIVDNFVSGTNDITKDYNSITEADLNPDKVNMIHLSVDLILDLHVLYGDETPINQGLDATYSTIVNNLLSQYGSKYKLLILGFKFVDNGLYWMADEQAVGKNFTDVGSGSSKITGKDININSTGDIKNLGSSISAANNLNITLADDSKIINEDSKYDYSYIRRRSGEKQQRKTWGTFDQAHMDGAGTYWLVKILSSKGVVTHQYRQKMLQAGMKPSDIKPETYIHTITYEFTWGENGEVSNIENEGNRMIIETFSQSSTLNTSSIGAGNKLNISKGTLVNQGITSTLPIFRTIPKDVNAVKIIVEAKDLEGYKVSTDIIDPSKPKPITVNTTNLIDNSNFVGSNSKIEIKEEKRPPFQYMYENRLEFVDLSKYYGSEYFFHKIGYNPEKDAPIVLVGDAYVETKIITKKIEELIGNHYVTDVNYSDVDQIAYMYENAAREKTELNLTVGIKLTPEQVAKLTSDIIWLEEQEINGVKVLVPQVYIRKLTIDNIAMMGNSIIASKNIVAKLDNFQNSGYVSAGETVQIRAKEITNNNSGIILGNDVQLLADNDINIQGAMVLARNKVVLNAGNNVNIVSKVETKEEYGVVNTNSKTNEKTGVGIVKSVINYGSSIDGNDVSINAGNNANIIGSDIKAENDITIGAKNDVNILAVKDSKYTYTQTREDSEGLLGKSKTTTTETYDETVVGSNIEAKGKIAINAGHDVNVIGSNLKNTEEEVITKNEKGEEVKNNVVNGSIEINATGNVKVAEAREVHTSNTVVEEKGFVFEIDKKNWGLKAGVETNKTTTSTIDDLARGSELDGGNIALEGKEITLQGAKVNSNSDVNLTADDVKILEAKDIEKTETKTETTFAGLNASVNQSLVHADDNLKKITQVGNQLAGNSSDIINGAFGVVDGIRGTADAINAAPDVKGSGASKGNGNTADKMSADYNNLGSFSIGVQHTTTTTQDYSETAVASDLQAKNINIKSKKDTTIQGSNLNASENIVIEAENLSVLASQTKATSSSSSQTESLTIGLSSKNMDPTSVTASLSQNTADNEKVTNQNAKLTAGGNLKVTTTNDMIVKGGVVKADTVDLDIGNNLIVQSVQDTEKGKTASRSVSVTYGIASQSLSGSLAIQNGYTDNAWVTEQSGITAKNGGSISVTNKTELKGAVIASENSDKAVELDTKTFTYEDIKDKQEGETKGISISGGTNSIPSISVQYASNDKRQDTNATLSNVALKVDGKDVDPNTTGVNTDITKAQVITKDEKVDMIDVNLQTDLANKEERNKIRDAKDKVGDVVETVKNAIDKNNVGTIKENLADNRFVTRGANAVEDDEKLSKLLNELKDKNLPIDDAKDIILATVQKMYLENGFTDMPNVKFEDGVSGGTDGARGTETGTIYLDINKIKAVVTKEGVGALVGLIAHETAHSIKSGEKTGNLLIEEDFADSKKELAEKRFTEAEGTLSGDERKEALAKVKKDVKDERTISNSLTVSSKDEKVENLVGVDDVVFWTEVGIGIATTHKILYDTNPEYKKLIDTGAIEIINGIAKINEVVAKKLNLSIPTLKTQLKGYMSNEKGPKFEENFGNDIILKELLKGQGKGVLNPEELAKQLNETKERYRKGDPNLPKEFKEKIENDIYSGTSVLTAVLGSYSDLKKNDDSGQVHHLNQDAAYKGDIPYKDGASVKLEGNIFKDKDSQHYEAHKELEKFWDQYRENGAKVGQRPTNAEYGKALEKSLIKAGLSQKEAKEAAEYARKNREEYGLKEKDKVKTIPGKINLKK